MSGRQERCGEQQTRKDRSARPAMTAALIVVAKRLAATVALLLVISLLIFSLLWLSPGSTLATLIGTRPATPQTVAAITREYHLHEGFAAQYLHWLAGAIHLDFGRSIESGASVTSVIAAHAPITLELATYTLLLTVLVGVPAGMLAGIRRGSSIDRGLSGLLVVCFSAPGFAVGIVLLYVFGVELGWFPVYGAGNGLLGRIYHLTLPAIAFSIFLTAIVARQTRAAILDVMERDYIVFARARGLSECRILVRYALRNIAVPVVNTIGVVLIVALSGALFIEEVFSLQGDGYLMYQSVTSRDIPVVQGLAMFVALLVVIVNLAVDVLTLAVDPRTRYPARADR
jgi:peptide/nickel transport system permease protein